jgi:hypothetical protein
MMTDTTRTQALGEMMGDETLGRFGHHPDPAIDFEVEVEELIGMAYNRRVRFDPEPDLDARVERAMRFVVGGDPGAVAAKHELRKIDAELRRPSPAPDEGGEDVSEARIRELIAEADGAIPHADEDVRFWMDTVTALTELLARRRSGFAAGREAAWLIERLPVGKEDQPPMWWRTDASSVRMLDATNPAEWTRNASEAVRFSRREDAARVACALNCWATNIVETEHVFIGGISALGETVEAPAMYVSHNTLKLLERDPEARDAAISPYKAGPLDQPLYSAAALAALQGRVDQVERENKVLRAEIGGSNANAAIADWRELTTRAEAAEARAEALQAEIDKYAEALDWYGKMAADCRKISRDGEIARQALDRDGGSRARALSNAEGAGDVR